MFPDDRCQFGEELQNTAAVITEQKVEDQNPDYLNQQVAGSVAKPTAASQAASMAGPLIKVKPSSFILASGSLGTGKLSNKATALSNMTVRQSVWQ